MARYTVTVVTKQEGDSPWSPFYATVDKGPIWLKRTRIRSTDQQQARRTIENYIAGIRWPHHQFTFVHK